MPTLSLLVSLAPVLASLAAVLAATSSLPRYPVGIAPATWDGKCTYPAAFPGFDANKYVGPEPSGASRAVWYQLAAQDQIFELGCTCVYALYGSYPNGTVSVQNVCTRAGQSSSIKGVARPSPKGYGTAGVFRVDFGFPSNPLDPCAKGPNYVVQKAWTSKPGETKRAADANEGGAQAGDYQTVVVSSADFDGWFLLSRTRVVSQDVVDDYLKEVAALGNDLSKSYSITKQSGCPAVNASLVLQ